MRSAVVDHRLEAIAGKPVVDVRERGRRHQMGIGHTIIAVGRYVPNETGSNQRLFSAALAVHVGGTADPAVTVVGAAVGGVIGAAYYGYATTTAAGAVTIGAAASGDASWDWLGPIRAVVYDRTLTDAQAMDVVRWLASNLGM